MRAKKRMAAVLLIVIFSMLIIFKLSSATIAEKYTKDRIKEKEEKELQTQSIEEKMREVTTAMSNVASAVAAYHEDLKSWPLFDRADAKAIETNLGVRIPNNIIRSISVTSPTDDEVTITAIIKNIDSAVDGKTLILRGKLTGNLIIWHWDGTVPSIFIPNGENLNYDGLGRELVKIESILGEIL